MVCIFCTYSTPQSELVVFVELNNHMWLMAVVLDSVGIRNQNV